MILIISLILYLLSSSPVFFYILIPILLLQALNSLSSSFNGAIPPSQGLARNTQRFSLHSSGPQTKALALAKDAESIAARKRKAAENEKGGAEAQEETTAAAVPLEEDSAMAAAGGSGSAANPSPSADEVPIVCDYDGWSCFRDDDVMQQQSAIRAEEAAKIPYVGDKEPLSSLAAEFQSGSPIVQEKIKLIGEQYSFLRRTRGDGNCFFRSFMFSYLEHILETQDKAEVERITVNIDQCKKTLQSLGYADFTFEDFFSIFIEQLESVLQGTDTSISHEELLQRSRDQNVSDYVVMFFRFVTSGEIRRRSDFFEPFIAGLKNSTVDQFCKASVEPMGEESDHVHITAMSDALGVPIRVLYLDRSSCEAGAPTVNHHDFIPSVTLPNPPPVQGNGPTTTATDNVDPSVPPPDKIAVATSENSLPTPVVTLLYRPGHYDILYAK